MYIRHHYVEWTGLVVSCLQQRLQNRPVELKLMTNAVVLLATHGWERSSDSSFGHNSIKDVLEHFSGPLENAGIDVTALVVCEEWDDMAKPYLDLFSQDYKVVWWKLFRAIDAKNWPNILGVLELLFCIPVANGHLERVFSQMKLIKTNRQSCLSGDTLDHLLRINVEGPPLSDWDATGAVDSWWKDKSRRLGGKETHQRASTSATHSEEESTSLSLEEWDAWMTS